jgi:hypothetical protein
MVRPFIKGLAGTACPIKDVFEELATQLSELRAMKKTLGLTGTANLGLPHLEDADDHDSDSMATITPRATPTPTPESVRAAVGA